MKMMQFLGGVTRKFKGRTGGNLSDEQAQLYGTHIYNKLMPKYNNKLTTKNIVKEARPTSSPFHKYFEWEDSKAAEKYRENQARNLMEYIVIVDSTESGKEIEVRSFVNVYDKEEKERVYTTMEVALDDEFYFNQIWDKMETTQFNLIQMMKYIREKTMGKLFGKKKKS